MHRVEHALAELRPRFVALEAELEDGDAYDASPATVVRLAAAHRVLTDTLDRLATAAAVLRDEQRAHGQQALADAERALGIAQ